MSDDPTMVINEKINKMKLLNNISPLTASRFFFFCTLFVISCTKETTEPAIPQCKPSQFKHVLGETFAIEYNNQGRIGKLISSKEVNGKRYAMGLAYDEQNRLRAATHFLGADAAGTDSVHYGVNGLWSHTTRQFINPQTGQVTTRSSKTAQYDTNNRLVKLNTVQDREYIGDDLYRTTNYTSDGTALYITYEYYPDKKNNLKELYNILFLLQELNYYSYATPIGDKLIKKITHSQKYGENRELYSSSRSYSYEFDADGNVLNITETDTHMGTFITPFAYKCK